MARSATQDRPKWTSESAGGNSFDTFGTFADALSPEKRDELLNIIENKPVEDPEEKQSLSQTIPPEAFKELNLEESTQPGVSVEVAVKEEPSTPVTPVLGRVAVQTIEPIIDKTVPKVESTPVSEQAKASGDDIFADLKKELDNRSVIEEPKKTAENTSNSPITSEEVKRVATQPAETKPVSTESTPITVEAKLTPAQEVLVPIDRKSEKANPREAHPVAHANQMHATPHQVTEPAPHPERLSFLDRVKKFFNRNEESNKAPVSQSGQPTTEEQMAPKKAAERKKPIRMGEEWGSKDKIKPEDVPEGEMTLQQYLARRPVAKEGDIGYSTDKNGRDIAYELTTGHRVKLAENPRGQFDDTETNRYYTELFKKNVESVGYDEASAENAEFDSSMSERVRAGIEGKYIAQKDDGLRGLMALGQEILGLTNSKQKPGDFETRVKPIIEAKQKNFDDLLRLYRLEGADPRAIQYVYEQSANKSDENSRSIEGATYMNGEKVEVLDFYESPLLPGQNPADRQRVYSIKTASGETLLKSSNELEFKRDYVKEAVIAAEAEQSLVSEAEPKTRLEKLKRWVSVNAQQWNEFGGGNWIGSKGALAKKFFLERKITPDMNEHERQAQLDKNRRNNILGLVAGGLALGVGGMLIGANLHESFDASSLPAGGPGTGGGGEANLSNAVSGGLESVNMPSGIDHDIKSMLDGSAGSSPVEVVPVAPVDLGINNPLYDIPKNQGGIKLFENLGLSEVVWNDHAATLAANYPQDFEVVGNDVRITHGGWLSSDARTYIEQIRAQQ